MPRIPQDSQPPKHVEPSSKKPAADFKEPRKQQGQGNADPFAAMQSIGSIFADTYSLKSNSDLLGTILPSVGLGHKVQKVPSVARIRKSPGTTLKQGGPTALRLLKSRIEAPEIQGRLLERLHVHSTFCQISLPYRKPSDDVREFERVNGNLRVEISAGKAMHPKTGELIKIGLPWGPKVRLVQIYLDSVAVSTRSSRVETGQSLTAFITDKLRLSNDGRTINSVRDALIRLAASRFLFAVHHPDKDKARTVKGDVIREFELLLPKGENHRVLFPPYVDFSPEYFADLVEHAVPLKFTAVSALSHNSMALDCYRWLAHRLHRVSPEAPYLLFWSVLYAQFSSSSTMRMADFRAEFRNALGQALSQYPEAKGKVLIDNEVLQSLCKDGRGIWLYNAPPPVLKKQILVKSLH